MIRIGTSGWTYPSWSGVFYPAGLPARERLEFYAGQFDTVELNASYYRWPSDAQFASWRTRLPDGFAFTVKAPKQLTHRGGLREVDEWCGIVTRGLTELGDRRGPLLLQFPPSLTRDEAGLAHLLSRFPRAFRLAVEFRHASWRDEATRAVLREYGAAVVATAVPDPGETTADFVYVRLHGPNPRRPYHGTYPREQLAAVADAFTACAERGLDGYCYFNNDADGHAIGDARILRELLDPPPPAPREPLDRPGDRPHCADPAPGARSSHE